jgi:uncharacterized protein YdhG (YjbR/CyaY superfamily)
MTTTTSTTNEIDSTGPGAGFTAEERAAMQDRAAEIKAAKRRGPKVGKADGEAELLAKIAAMNEQDRAMAERFHALLSAMPGDLTPQTYYGMPAYAKDGVVVCWFKPGGKFRMRYSTLGFSDRAALDDGDMWPSEFALLHWTDAVEARITELVQRSIA